MSDEDWERENKLDRDPSREPWSRRQRIPLHRDGAVRQHIQGGEESLAAAVQALLERSEP